MRLHIRFFDIKRATLLPPSPIHSTMPPNAGDLLRLIDRGRSGHAEHLVLRAGSAGTTDSADDLAVLDQRNAATRGDRIVERHDVIEAEFLHRVLEGACRTPVSRRRTRLVLGDSDRRELRAV